MIDQINLQPRELTDTHIVSSMVGIHKWAIQISHGEAIKRINEFYKKEFYDPLDEFQEKVIENNNNRAIS